MLGSIRVHPCSSVFFGLLLVFGAWFVVDSMLAAKPDDPSMLPPQFRKLLPLHTKLANPAKRFQELMAFYKAHGLTAEQAFCEKSLAALVKK